MWDDFEDMSDLLQRIRVQMEALTDRYNAEADQAPAVHRCARRWACGPERVSRPVAHVEPHASLTLARCSSDPIRI